MSSRNTGSARETAVAGEPAPVDAASAAPVTADPAAGPGAPSGVGAAAADEQDSWFQAAPAAAGTAAADAGEPAGAEPGFDPSATSEWFLPEGRAGLQPESMTVTWDEDTGEEPGGRPTAQGSQPAGAPPWAGESGGPQVSTPPPWETGPWPGPGGPIGPTAVAGPAQPAGDRQAPAGGPSVRTLWVAGAIPLVLPGLVAGALGLRANPSGPARQRSWLAIAMSLAWAVVIVVIVVSTSGGPAAGCSYPAAVHQAYTKVMADFSSSAAARAQAADLGTAASQANTAAAGAGQIGLRSALSTLAGDLQQARADLTDRRTVPAALRRQLAADGPALVSACSPTS
ncbi:MAG TPA: hypothetical protein VGI58_15955 [Streptosporangiaceae bacterium]